MDKNNNILRIIIIDDNPAIHQDFIKILTANKNKSSDHEKLQGLENAIFGEANKIEKLPNFTIDTASQGIEGVELIKKAFESGNPYSLAFVDIRMPPGIDGIETIKRIWQIDKNIQIVICTAYSDYSWEETVDSLGQTDNLLILKKPFDNIAVRQLACALTRKWQLLQEAKAYTESLESRIKERTQSLRQSLSLTRATLESSGEGIVVVNNDGVLIDNNNKFIEMWSISTPTYNSKKFLSMIEEASGQIENINEFLDKIKDLHSKPDEVLIGIIKFNDKRVYEYYTQPYLFSSESNEIIGRVWSFRDITKRASLEEELKYQATHDALTGLPNRVLMLDRLRQSIAVADRNKGSFAILFLDLDRFKLINDSLSHEAGDEILRTVSNRLQATLRDEDTLVRLGGDEFVVIINGVNEDHDVVVIAHKLLSTFKEAFTINEHKLSLSTSIGISLYPQDGKSIDSLLRNADTAMYHAKDLGANQYQFYRAELNEKTLERLDHEEELREAIKNEEFFLAYQPQFDLKNEQLVSVEALIRWKHPTKGIILPIDFIPLTEETGLIIPIGEWVLRTACKQNKAWQNLGLPPIRIAVNITTKQIKLYNFVDIVKNILTETQLEPQYLELELTENMIINNASTLKTINEVKKLGVQIALDDFGTGYSSLNYLREFPVDRLKIDQSFVQNIDSNRGDDVIIQAIITMAHKLNLEVLAEGVETERQYEFLKNQKCGEFQGFYFSKPINTDECEKLLRKSTDIKSVYEKTKTKD